MSQLTRQIFSQEFNAEPLKLVLEQPTSLISTINSLFAKLMNAQAVEAIQLAFVYREFILKHSIDSLFSLIPFSRNY